MIPRTCVCAHIWSCIMTSLSDVYTCLPAQGYHPQLSTRPDYKRSGNPVNITNYVKTSAAQANEIVIFWAHDILYPMVHVRVCVERGEGCGEGEGEGRRGGMWEGGGKEGGMWEGGETEGSNGTNVSLVYYQSIRVTC